MEVELDGRPLEMDCSGIQTAGELAQKVRDQLASDGRVLAGMTLDGLAVNLSETDGWAERTLAEPGQLVLRSEDSRDMCARVLREAADHLTRVAQAHLEMADVLRRGDLPQGSQMLGQWLPLWGVVQEALCKVAALLGWDIASTQVGSETVQVVIDALPPVLEQIRDSLQRQDFVSVADLLEYELAPLAGRWEGVCTQLAGRLQSGNP